MSWIRRNPALSGLSAALLCVLCVSSVTLGVLYYRERRAVSHFRDLLGNTLEGVRLHVEVAEDVLAKLPASGEQRYNLHKSALETLQSVARGLNYNHESRYRLSVANSYLSQAASQIHRLDESASYRMECIRLIEELLVESPGNIDYLYDRFYSRKCMAEMNLQLPISELIKKQEDLLPLIRQVRDLAPDNVDYMDAEAAVYYRNGELRHRHDFPLGKEYLIKAIAMSESLYRENPNKLLFTKYAFYGRVVLADTALRLGNLQEAEQHSIEGERFLHSIDHPDKGDYWFLYQVIEIHRVKAYTCIALERWKESIDCLEQCIEVQNKLIDYDPIGIGNFVTKAKFLVELVHARRRVGIRDDREPLLLEEIETCMAKMSESSEKKYEIPGLMSLLENSDAEQSATNDH